MTTRPPDRFGRPWGHPDYGADAPKDLAGRPWGSDNYGADPPSSASTPAVALPAPGDPLADLVRRVSLLEKNQRRAAAGQPAFGNVKILGGTFDNPNFGPTTTATFAQIGGMSRVVPKANPTSKLVIAWWVDFIRRDAAGVVLIEVIARVDAATTGSSHATLIQLQPLDEHTGWGGYTAYGGLDAGDRTVSLSARTVNGRSFEANSNSTCAMLIFEAPSEGGYS